MGTFRSLAGRLSSTRGQTTSATPRTPQGRRAAEWPAVPSTSPTASPRAPVWARWAKFGSKSFGVSQRGAVLCSYTSGAVLCSYTSGAVLCSYTSGAVLCSYTSGAFLCSYTSGAVLCSYTSIASKLKLRFLYFYVCIIMYFYKRVSK